MIRALLLAMLLATPAGAVQPDEILADPVLEQRARDLSDGLRCVVCRNESIDESNAEIARDMRIALRERLVAGDTDAEAVQFLVDRYGEYVLLNPRAEGANLILWAAAPALLLMGLGLAAVAIRRTRAPAAPLSAEEQARLARVLDEDR
jgi:cytochrome c-type biogenesis protein CcmH